MKVRDGVEIYSEDRGKIAVLVENTLICDSRTWKSGAVVIRWISPTPDLQTGRAEKTEKYLWDGRPDSCQMAVADFIVPSAIRGRGVGTLTWSLIAKGFNRLGVSIRVHGVLVARDAVSYDDAPERGYGPLVETPNLDRRNQLWQSILAPGARFTSDVAGDGRFCGYLIDPVPEAASCKYEIRWV